MGASLSLILISHYPSSFDTARTPTTLMCSLVSFSLSLQDHTDARDMSEHISARSCPCFSLFKTVQMHRTRASTLVLARVFISLSSTPRGRTGHKRACRCLPVSFTSITLSLTAGTPRTRANTGACSCLVCLSCYLWMPRTWVSTSVLTRVPYVSNPVPSTPRGHPGHGRAY